MTRWLAVGLVLAILLGACGRYGRPVRPKTGATQPGAGATQPQATVQAAPAPQTSEAVSPGAEGAEPTEDEEEE